MPVKRLDLAKSRMRDGVDGVPQLALAFALDTVAAALAATRVEDVIVVTSDPIVSERVLALGAVVIADPVAGLNGAVAAGAATTRAPVAILTGDLPALIATELDHALELAELHDLAMVADHGGTGTTLLTATGAVPLVPRFGPGSRTLHEVAGHVVLGIPANSALRWDVDTPDDLAVVLSLGVGQATAAAAAAHA